MKRILTGLQVVEGERLPSWYGFAYRNYCADHAICFPIPINLIVRWSRDFKWLLKRHKADALEDAYIRGFLEGRRDFLSREAREEQRYANVIKLIQK